METKKRVLFVFIASFLLVAMLSLVMAAKPEGDNSTSVNESAKEAKNMTYGQCVVIGVEAKNACYKSVKDTYSSCKANATESKECRTSYKSDMAQCKKDFKSVKNECRKIKHNFFETARYAFA